MSAPPRLAVVVGVATVAALSPFAPALASAGSSATSAATASSGPHVSAVSPSYGRPGEPVRIHGHGFTAGTDDVAFGRSAPVLASYVSPTTLTVTVPDDATTGTVKVTEAELSGPTTPLPGHPRYTVQALTHATVSVSQHTVTTPHPVTVVGTVTSGSAAVRGSVATVQQRRSGSSSWQHVPNSGRRTADSHGRVSWSLVPTSTLAYRVVFQSSHRALGATSGAHTVRLHPLLSVAASPLVVVRSPFTLHGTVRPHLPGKVLLERKVNGHWRHQHHMATHAGKFSTRLTAGAVGTLRYRVVRAADSQHLVAISKAVTVNAVRETLRYGDSGTAVLKLQKRLRALHYDVGPVTGDYGWDTLHAVTVFEKVQRLSADGVASPTVLARLAHPRVPQLRYAVPGGNDVEVNLGHQWLIIVKNGHIWRILDTSTAGGYYYTDSEGQQEQAITPTGHFTIQYKQDGTVHARLGTLYRPSYFNSTGYAIHGEGNGNDGGEVPPYANSHGCVRITDDAVNRYYDLLAIGMSVYIYH